MSVCAEDFLIAAEELLKNGSCEIDYRNSISRAYYAAFHLLKTITDTSSNSSASNQGYNSHNDTIDKLSDFPKSIEQKVIVKAIRNNILKRKRMRKDADYELSLNLDEKDAEAHLNNVQLLFDDINRLSALLKTP